MSSSTVARDERELLDLIDLVYAAAVQPLEWTAVLERFARTTDSLYACILVHDRSGNRDLSSRVAGGPWVYGVPQWAMRECPDWAARNVIMQAAVPLMRTGMIFKHSPIAKRDLLCSAFYRDFLSRFAPSSDVMGACIALEESVAIVLAAGRHISKPDYGADDHRVVRRILPHLQRAVSIHRRLRATELQRNALGDVFDRLGSAIFVLDDCGRVLTSNRTAGAILDAADGLSLRVDGALCAAAPADEAALQRLIADACRTGAGRGGGASGALQVQRRGQRRPYAVIVSPLVLPRLVLLTQRPAAVVFATDIERARTETSGLRSLFNLTPAEAKVAGMLATGERAGDIAERLQLALPTVRTHIRRLLDKTGARGQPDLVRVLLASLAGMDSHHDAGANG